jgi:hypothetical protein
MTDTHMTTAVAMAVGCGIALTSILVTLYVSSSYQKYTKSSQNRREHSYRGRARARESDSAARCACLHA